MANPCVICGKPVQKYLLCADHWKMKREGTVVKCETCGTWHETSSNCKCEPKPIPKSLEKKDLTQNPLTSLCVVCGESANGKPQCKRCYEETVNFIDGLDKNSNVHSFRDYYYNLKDRIFIMKDIDVTQRNCNKLIAIAYASLDYCNDSSLIDRVYKDVETLIANKKTPPIDDKFKEERQERDEDKSKLNTSQDGHNLKSNMEVIIDDVLYNSYILHCYEKTIDEIGEARKKCDWFIPICNGKGIYIEYFGMTTEKYLKDKKEKIELYKKNNVPFITIEKDDPKKDTMSFRSNLIRDITKLAKDIYGFMPEWKQ